MPRDLAETLALSVAAAVAAAGAFVASGGGLLLGLALYSVVGSVTLLTLSTLRLVDARVRVTRGRRAYL